MSEIYVVLNHGKVVGASTSWQGAELVRADTATQLTDETFRHITGGSGMRHDSVRWQDEYRIAYDLMDIQNTDLQDDDQ
jgi:hypothetical protein